MGCGSSKRRGPVEHQELTPTARRQQLDLTESRPPTFMSRTLVSPAQQPGSGQNRDSPGAGPAGPPARQRSQGRLSYFFEGDLPKEGTPGGRSPRQQPEMKRNPSDPTLLLERLSLSSSSTGSTPLRPDEKRAYSGLLTGSPGRPFGGIDHSPRPQHAMPMTQRGSPRATSELSDNGSPQVGTPRSQSNFFTPRVSSEGSRSYASSISGGPRSYFITPRSDSESSRSNGSSQHGDSPKIAPYTPRGASEAQRE